MLITAYSGARVATPPPVAHYPVDIVRFGSGCVPPPREPGLPAIRVTMAGIAQEVAAAHGVRVSDLKGQSRRRIYSRPRQEVMWRCRAVFRSDGSFRYSLPLIGRFLGDRDHTTVLHGVRAHAKRLKAAAIAAVRADNDAFALIHGAAE